MHSNLKYLLMKKKLKLFQQTISETSQAIHSTLNHQRNAFKRLLKNGSIESDGSGKMRPGTQGQIKTVIDSPEQNNLPESMIMLSEADWLMGLEPKLLKKVVDSFTKRTYSPGECLFREDRQGDGLYIILSGNVKIEVNNSVIEILGPGSVIGEIANLMNVPRTATIIAEHTVTVLIMSSRDTVRLMKESVEIEKRLWKIAGARYVENYLAKIEPYVKWNRNKLKKWIASGDIAFLVDDESIELVNKTGILLSGVVYVTSKNNPIEAPAVLYAPVVYANKTAKIFYCDKSG